MYFVKIDEQKNRLYLTLGAIEDEAEMLEILEQTHLASQKLNKGFTCLNDLRRYDPDRGMHDEYIQKMQENLIRAGMSKVVRVRSPMGSMAHYQFNNVSYTSHEEGYYAPNVTSIEEGERLLDDSSR